MDEWPLWSKPMPRFHIPLIKMPSLRLYLLHTFPHIGSSKYIQAFITPDQYRQIQIWLWSECRSKLPLLWLEVLKKFAGITQIRSARHHRHPHAEGWPRQVTPYKNAEPSLRLLRSPAHPSSKSMEALVSKIKPATATPSWNLDLIPNSPNKIFLVTGGTQGSFSMKVAYLTIELGSVFRSLY